MSHSLITLMHLLNSPSRNTTPLNHCLLNSIDLHATVDILELTKREESLSIHITALAINAAEIRSPRSFARAQFFGVLIRDVGDDETVNDPLWSWRRGSRAFGSWLTCDWAIVFSEDGGSALV